MAKENEAVVAEVTEEPKAFLVRRDDGFHVIDEDGTEGDVCKYCDEGDKTIVLTPNASNRKWYNRAKAEKALEESDRVALYFKGTRHFDGTSTPKFPNASLIKYLSEDEQAEYAAIIERARAAKQAARKVPMTDEEKLEARIAKLKAKLAQLQNEEVTE